MAKINLLPWRERLQEERKQEFYVGLVGSAILAFLIMALVHVSITYRADIQLAKNDYLQSEINLLDAKIREIESLGKIKNALLSRMGIIQELQTNRTLVVHLFDELVTILPKGIHLTEIQRKGTTVILTGKTESNMNVSELMRNINKSRWLSNPVLSEIKTDQTDNGKSTNFSLSLQLVNPYENKEIKS